MESNNTRSKLELFRTQLKNERSSFEPHWRDVSDYIIPRRARFFTSDVNKGDRRNQKILDSSATLALRTLRSGMMSGITSPARPWFRLTTPDPDMAEFGSVKDWLHVVSKRMTSVFIRSNIYQKLPTLYGDLGGFGTAAISIEKDFNSVIRSQSFPIGSYALATNYKGMVDSFVYDFVMTVKQIVDQFGQRDKNGKVMWDNISDYVRDQYQLGNYSTWIECCQIIKPNEDYDPSAIKPANKKFISFKYERGTVGTQNYLNGGDMERVLKKEGFDVFPILAPRWEVNGEDTYGTDCPGFTALGDIKALQVMHKRKAQAVEKIVNPPMIAPISLMNRKSSILPGEITYVDPRDQAAYKPAHEINFRVGELMEDIRETQYRIKRAFYEDLFLMFTESDRRQITAREIEERGQEKLLAIGPVLEQLNQDLLDPMIDSTFAHMLSMGLIPPPPEELQGVDLRIEYVSVMAQAQKMVGISGVERFTSFVANLAAVDPTALDKFNRYEAINVYADMTSVPPKLVVPDEEAQAIKAQRDQAAQMQAQAQMAAQAAQAAQSLSATKTDEKSALTDLLGMQE